MGQGNSKSRKGSYNVAPVASDREFKFENNQNKSDNRKQTTQRTNSNLNLSNLSNASASSTIVEKESEKPFDANLIPAWLTEELFVDLLKEHIEGFERISYFKAYPALSAGENYATLMLRISIDAELNDKSNKNVSFMLKVAHNSDQMKQLLSIANYFIPENEIYSVVIPEMEQMFKEVGVDITIAPKAYKFAKDIEHNYVLLQDLQPLGFQNAKRTKRLDMKHAKFALRKLAQFHAVSATRIATKGPYNNFLMNGIFAGKQDAFTVFESVIETFKTPFLSNLKTFKDGEKYEPFLRNYLDNVGQQLQNTMVYDENEFNVLNHGDCWSNNILFKYNDAGDITDMMFVDFQMSKYGSPAQDLYYFIFSSLQIDIKLKEFDYLIRFYYDNLIENLKLLNYPKKQPLLCEIYIQLFKSGIWALWTTVIVLPIVLLDPTEKANIDNFMSGSEDGMAFKSALFSNNRYKEHINEIMPWIYNRGLMEFYNSSILKPLASNDTSAELSEKTKSSLDMKSASPQVQIPQWITESLFVDILKENFPDFKSIKTFNISSGSTGGENYASLILQIDIDMELLNEVTKTASFMMKVALSNEGVNAVLSYMNLFEKEISMYNEFIPKFEDIFKKAGVDIQLGVKYFHLTEKHGKDIVILENLRPLGFTNCNRLEGLDENHTKAVLHKLAEFHAASACYALENEYPKVLQNGMFVEEQRDVFEKMGDSLSLMFNESLKTFDGNEEYYDKMITSRKTFFDTALKAYDRKENCINVLNHGDVWTNNILFKHNENGEIETTYLIDYQMVQYGSPAIDLYYFLISSPAFDIKLENFDFFVKYYYDHLVENLKLLKYPNRIPSLKELQQEMLKKGVLGVSAVTGILSFVLLDPTEFANMENIMSEEAEGVELRRLMYSNARYKKHAEAIFPWLNRRGLLDAE